MFLHRKKILLFVFIYFSLISQNCFSQQADTSNYSQAFVQSRYKELIASGDLQFRYGNYADAKVFYLDALVLLPDDQYAFDRLTTCDLRLRYLAENKGVDVQYSNLIYLGDYCFNTRYYIDAKKKYKAALALKPNEQYPKDRIASCDYKIAEYSPNAKDSLLPQFLKQADSLYAAKDYSNALQWYRVAVNFSQGRADVQKKIDRLKIIVDSIDYEEKNPPVEYWPNGHKKIERVGTSQGTFYYKEYNANDTLVHEGQMTNGQRTGLWISYFPFTGMVSEKVSYKLGQVDGVYESWYRDGKLYMTGQYVEGMKEGLWKEYSDSGFVFSTTAYKNGMRDGMYTEYYPSGKKLLVATYAKDQLMGMYTEYYEAGKVKSRKLYIADVQSGVETRYWPNGKKSFQQTYNLGEPIDEAKCWDENGKEIIQTVVH